MINVTEIPMNEQDIEDIRLWAKGYRENRPIELPWSQFAEASDIKMSTLQAFVSGKYQGRNDNIARKIFLFRQSVEAQSKRQKTLPIDPGFFETKSALRMRAVMSMAHFGRITVIAAGPGTGKTMAITDYRERAQPTFVATLRPSTSTLLQMILEVHRALGIPPRCKNSAEASRMVVERLHKQKALLVIDEANYACIDAIEEIRSWHDETGVGICLAGNEELLRRIETGQHRDQFARLNRRIQHKHEQDVPEAEDVEAFCDAWQIEQPDIRGMLAKIALTPGAGGLGECQQLIEVASMLASEDGEDRGLTISDMRDAQMTRKTRWIRA